MLLLSHILGKEDDNMNKIVITTDSGIDPIHEETMIPGQIVENKIKSYQDMKEITPKEILEKIKTGSNFKTSSPMIGDYEKMFIPYLENQYDIIHLSMSSGISEGSVNSANLMATIFNDEYENKIHVIDTLNGATGGTLLEQFANDLVKDGCQTSEIVEKLQQVKTKLQTSFYVPNPEGFIRSGRNKSEMCLKDKALLMGVKTALVAGIKFRVDFNPEGNLYTKGFIRSQTKSGMLKMVKQIIDEKNKELYDSKYVVVGTLNENQVKMEEIISYLNQLNYFDHVIRQDINGVVAAYGSDDLCGISLVKKM